MVHLLWDGPPEINLTQNTGSRHSIIYYLCGRLYVKDLGKQNRHGLCLQGIYSLMGETGIKQVKNFLKVMTFCVLRAGKRKNRCYEKVADVHFGRIREDLSEG